MTIIELFSDDKKGRLPFDTLELDNGEIFIMSTTGYVISSFKCSTERYPYNIYNVTDVIGNRNKIEIYVEM